MDNIYSKKEIISKLKEIRDLGWIRNNRPGNAGGVGNTLEDLLGIKENNLPIPNASEWELKSQRNTTNSLTTLFHCEPSPIALKIVPSFLLPKYGWRHNQAGGRYPETEMSFRQTISGVVRSDRGFVVIVNKTEKRIEISFDYKFVDNRHIDWLESVKNRIGLKELDPQPYWGFDDIFHKAGTKLHNTFYVIADSKKDQDGIEYYFYKRILQLTHFSIEGWIRSIEEGGLFIDFDERTGHNHGTKFRLKQNFLPNLYASIKEF